MGIYHRFTLYIAITIVINIVIKYALKIDLLIYNSLSDKLTQDQIKGIINIQEKWQWISYVAIPLLFLLKIYLIASVLFIGTFFFSKINLTFKQLKNVVIKSEFIFLIVSFTKVVWFYFFQTNYTLEDIQFFFPLSALNIIGYKGVDTWLLYPLQTLNLFEVAYIIYLSYQIGYLTKTNADYGLKIVGYSYVPALLLWVTVVMFFTLNYS